MNRYHHLTCREWDEKLEMTDPEMLTDEEIEGFNLHIASCSRCASLISDPEMDTLIRENISLEEVFTMLPHNTYETSTNETSRKFRRSIFIGLGETGNEIVYRLKREVEAHLFDTPLFQYCVIDADEHTTDTPVYSGNSMYLNIGHSFHESTSHTLQTSAAIASWWGERSTAYLEIDESVHQMRATGRRHLFEHFDEVKAALQTIVNATTNSILHRQVDSQGFEMLDAPPVVYLVFSPGDALGSGLFLDIAYLMQELFKPHVSAEIVALAMLPGSRLLMAESYTRLQANTYAALQELEHYTNTQSTWDVSYPSNMHISSTNPPFSSVYLVDNTNEKGETYPLEHVYEQVKRLLYWLCIPEISTSTFKHDDGMGGGDMLSHITDSSCIEHVKGNDSESEEEDIGQLPIYSTFGISHAHFDWQAERVRSQAEMFFYEQFLHQQVASPTLPTFLRNATVLSNTIKKDMFSFKSYIPPDKMFDLPERILPEDISTEMKRLKRAYDKALSNFEEDSQWQQLEMKYIGQASAAISTFIHITLKEHGPVYVHQALEEMLASLQKLRDDLDILHQEQIRDKLTFDQQLSSYFERWETTSEVSKDYCRRKKPTLEKFLYDQYMVALLEKCFKHIITHLFNPIARFTEQQKALFADAKRKLASMYARAIEYEDERQQRRDEPLTNTIQPRLNEQKHLENMIVSGVFDIEALAHQILQETYEMWPFDDEDTDGIGRLQKHINRIVTQALGDLGQQEHLAYRLQSPECGAIRRRFVAESAYMVNMIDTAKRRLLPELDSLHILNYGLRSSQSGSCSDIEIALGRLSIDIAAHPLLRLTESENELTLINVVHGFSLSSLCILDELHRAYELVTKSAHAPYLHLYLKNQEGGCLAPTKEPFTFEQLLETWRTLLENVSNRRTVLLVDLEVIFKPLEDYSTSNASRTAFIQVDAPDHPFFDVLLRLRETITTQLNVLSLGMMQTPEVRQILTTLADMEAMLFAQGWHKIDPPQYTLFNPQFHHRYLEDDTEWSANKRARIIEVVSPGYMRQPHYASRLIRRAEVIVSIWSGDNQERPVIAEKRQ